MSKLLAFPGQGSQTIGMAADFCENFKESKLVFEEAEDAIKISLRKLCFEGPMDELTLTHNLQPALFTAEVAMVRALEAHMGLEGVKAVAGHSLGEYSALAATYSLTVADGAKLTRKRGEAMQKAVPVGTGTMAAILGLDSETVEKLCKEAMSASGEVVEAANFNAPGQVVISGSVKGVEAGCTLLKANGGKAIPLQVSAPFHCSLMKAAMEEMTPLLKTTKFSKPKFPLIANVNAELVTDETKFAELLIQQIVKSVRWEQSMKLLRGLEIEKVIEVGPGKVLSGLMKRIDKDIQCVNVSSVELLKSLQ